MTIAKKDAKLLIILLGIVVVVAAYLAIYKPYQDKTEALETEITLLKPQLTELQAHYAKLTEYYEGIDASTASMRAEMSDYPSAVRSEDLIMYAVALEEDMGLDITSVTCSGPAIIAAFRALPRGDGTDFADLTAYQYSMEVNCSLGYNELKSMLDYIADCRYRTALNMISVSFDAETGELVGSASISKYFIAAPGDEYVATEVPSLPLGKDDLFETYMVTPEDQTP